MAEAFGLAAGVLQVASFGTEVGCTLWKCANKFRNASKELEAIAKEVETTALSLKQVAEFLKDPTTKARHAPKLYNDTNTVSEGCLDTFHELNDLVNDFGGSPRSSFGKMTLRSRTRWTFSDGKLTELGSILRRYSDVLHLMISVMAIVEGRQAAYVPYTMSTFVIDTDRSDSTRDDVQALNERLHRLTVTNTQLTMTNTELSGSNKRLVDIIASISGGPGSLVKPEMQALAVNQPEGLVPSTLPATAQDSVKAANWSDPLLIAVSIPPHIQDSEADSKQQKPPDHIGDHLRRCMDSVQELAKTITCAIKAWDGHSKEGSSDVHGSYAKVVANLKQLPPHVQCCGCAGQFPWAEFDPSRDVNGLGSCICSPGYLKISLSQLKACNRPLDTYPEDRMPGCMETPATPISRIYKRRPKAYGHDTHPSSGITDPNTCAHRASLAHLFPRNQPIVLSSTSDSGASIQGPWPSNVCESDTTETFRTAQGLELEEPRLGHFPSLSDESSKTCESGIHDPSLDETFALHDSNRGTMPLFSQALDRKRSHSEAFSAPKDKSIASSHSRQRKKSCGSQDCRASNSPTDSSSTAVVGKGENLALSEPSALEMLLERWVTGGATTVLSRVEGGNAR